MLKDKRLSLLGALAIGIICGCSDDGRLETYPVQGQVLINGEPADGCTVRFVPVDPNLQGEILPGGKTDEDGRFQLTTYESDDGAPAGEYDVTLLWAATKWPGRKAQMGADPVPPTGPDLLMGQFGSPQKSTLTATVSEEPNELAPFKLDDVRLLPGAE